MSTWLCGLGTAVPEHSISQADAAELVLPFNAATADQARVLRELYRRAGVRCRHSVVLQDSGPELAASSRQSTYQPPSEQQPFGPTTAERMRLYEQYAGTLAALATRRALLDAQLDAAEMTHLVTVSCSGFQAPGWDIDLLSAVGLSASVARTHIGFMGCHGALNGLRVADAFVRSDPHACVLLCCVELCSLHHQYGWSPDRVVSNALFADGAASAVLTQRGTAEDVRSRKIKLLASGSVVLPDTLSDMSWRIGDHGFEMTLSARVPDLIRQHLRPWLQEWLVSLGRRFEDVAHWAFHPGGPRILSAAGAALGLQREQWAVSEAILAEYGNMSSPTILFILDRLSRAPSAGLCVALAFGPGLTIEATLLEITLPT